MSPLDGWANFYVIAGSSAGALIGLQFVVITLIANRPEARGGEEVGDAFTTPSVVHFAVVLLVSALVSAPWGGVGAVSLLWGLLGLCGVAYTAVVARRMRSQDVYRPVFEDWLCHVLLPLVAYLLLAASALTAGAYARPALFVVGVAALLLLFVGIHNAWDTVTHLVFVSKGREKEPQADADERGGDSSGGR